MKAHPFTNEVLELARLALSKGNHFIAHCNSFYFLDKNDVHFFSSQRDAEAFAHDNPSPLNRYNFIEFHSIDDISNRIPFYPKESHESRSEPDRNELYNKEGNAFTDALIEHFESPNKASAKPEIEAQTNSLNLKTNVMKQENFEYLKDNLKYTGFGDKLSEQLEKEMKTGQPDFQLRLETEINNKAFAAVLNFRKPENSEMYFFNSYHATLQRKDGETVDQAFYLTKGKGVTAKEAFNLLDGRAVHKELTTKEGQPYKAWIQMDFDKKDTNNNHEVKQFHEKYGYDLKEAVSKYAFADLKDSVKEAELMKSLQKGNMQSVTFEKEGSVAKMFVEANPQFKTVNLYDGEMKRIQKESLERYQAVDKVPGKDQSQTEEICSSKVKVNGKEVDGGKGISTDRGNTKAEIGKENQGRSSTKKTKEKGVKELLPQKKGTGKKRGVKVN